MTDQTSAGEQEKLHVAEIGLKEKLKAMCAEKVAAAEAAVRIECAKAVCHYCADGVPFNQYGRHSGKGHVGSNCFAWEIKFLKSGERALERALTAATAEAKLGADACAAVIDVLDKHCRAISFKPTTVENVAELVDRICAHDTDKQIKIQNLERQLEVVAAEATLAGELAGREAAAEHMRCQCSPTCTDRHPWHGPETIRTLPLTPDSAGVLERIKKDAELKGWQDCLRNVRASLEGYPDAGGDIEIMQAVERIKRAERAHARLCYEACREFIRKCDSGEARSVRSQKQMREAIAAYELSEQAAIADGAQE